MKKNKPLKKLSTTPPDTKTQNHFVEKVERAPAPAEISCGADNSGRGTQKLAAKCLWTNVTKLANKV